MFNILSLCWSMQTWVAQEMLIYSLSPRYEHKKKSAHNMCENLYLKVGQGLEIGGLMHPSLKEYIICMQKRKEKSKKWASNVFTQKYFINVKCNHGVIFHPMDVTHTT